MGRRSRPHVGEAYAERSRADIHDWLTAMGVRFTSFRTPAGNSVARNHENPERGFGVVKPLYRECLRTEGITFEWNTRITDLDGTRRASHRGDGRAAADRRGRGVPGPDRRHRHGRFPEQCRPRAPALARRPRTGQDPARDPASTRPVPGWTSPRRPAQR